MRELICGRGHAFLEDEAVRERYWNPDTKRDEIEQRCPYCGNDILSEQPKPPRKGSNRRTKA